MQFLAKWQNNSSDSKVEEIPKQRSKKVQNSLQGFVLRKAAKTYELTISRGTIPEIMAYNRQFLEWEWAKSSG
jgi:ribosomal protein S17E